MQSAAIAAIKNDQGCVNIILVERAQSEKWIAENDF